jgi:hypothetical protein
MPARFSRKVLRTGSSRCAALPPWWLDVYGLGSGDFIEVYCDSVILIKPPLLKIDVSLLKHELDIWLRRSPPISERSE